MTGPEFLALYEDAVVSDATTDWHKVWQAFAGHPWVVPLDGQDGDTIRPSLIARDGVEMVQAYPDMASYAGALSVPGQYAELDGAQLAAMLAPAGAMLGLWLHADAPTPIAGDTLGWIASTFRADVDRTESAGVTVTAPDLPSPVLIQALGETVGALGRDCPEAWLVGMTEPGGASELVLVLGLSDSARAMEGQIAETVTRAVQAIADVPLAVACPARTAPLMETARRTGIGIGG